MKNKNKPVNEITISVEKPEDVTSTLKQGLTDKDKIEVIDSPNDTSMTNTVSPQTPLAEDVETQDKTSIKYLSNVKDSKTGEVSQPFTIDDKNYQLVRGILPSKEIVMGVFCHDEIGEDGENLIHSVEDFEKNIAQPVKERIEQEQKIVETPKPEDNSYEGYKHFFVNRKTNEIRKFKRIKELVSNQKLEVEDYMGLVNFKKHMNEKMFGKRKKVTETDSDGAMPPIKPEVPRVINKMKERVKQYMDELTDPDAKMQFLVKMADMLQLDTAFYPKFMEFLKKNTNDTFGNDDIAPKVSTVNENLTKSELEKLIISESLILNKEKYRKTIKTIKIKDIGNEQI